MKKAKGIIRAIQAFMDSARGKTLLNYFYSWGAAIVILGTLFKLTHMTGANIMLFVGMGTEVIVFFFSAFERPYEVAEDEKREEAAEETIAMGGQPIIINGPIMAGGMPVAGSIPQNNNTITENVVPVAQDTEVRPAEKQMMTKTAECFLLGGFLIFRSYRDHILCVFLYLISADMPIQIQVSYPQIHFSKSRSCKRFSIL